MKNYIVSFLRNLFSKPAPKETQVYSRANYRDLFKAQSFPSKPPRHITRDYHEKTPKHPWE